MKREREKHITRLHIILFFLAVIIVVVIIIGIRGRRISNEQKYADLEVEMVTASKTYLKRNGIELKDGHDTKISLKTLQQGYFIQNDLADSCKGYVLISRQKNYNDVYENNYESYISCDNGYMTDGYIEDYSNETDYGVIEIDIENVAKAYVEKNRIQIDERDAFRINIKDLIEKGFLDKKTGNKCEGYALVSRENTNDATYSIKYKAYIKCGDEYTTDGYSEE